MRWALNGSVAMNGREREGWEGVEGLQEGSKGLSYTDEWALASNHRVPSLSNESEDATRKESTCKLIFTKRKGYPIKIFAKCFYLLVKITLTSCGGIITFTLFILFPCKCVQLINTEDMQVRTCTHIQVQGYLYKISLQVVSH